MSNQNQKGISSLIGIIVVIVLGVAVIGGVLAYQYLWAPEKEVEVETPKTEAPTDETADWKVYRNEEYGFELKYPNIFQLKEQYGETFLFPEKDPIIYIFVGKNLSAASLECGGRCQYSESLVVFSEKNGNWSKDYIFDYGGMGSWNTVVNAYQQKDENYYILSLYAPKELGVPGMEGGGKPTKAELIAPELNKLQDKDNKDIIIFNQMLSTFRFIE